MRPLTLALTAVVVALVFVAGVLVGRGAGPGAPVTAAGPGDPAPSEPAVTTPDGGPADVQLVAALTPFDDCESLRSYYRDAALELVGPYGLDGGMRAFAEGGLAMESAAGGEASRSSADTAVAAAPPGTAVGPGATGTNVQEAGVDEPDLVKTDGELILAVSGERLRVVRAGSPPEVVGSLGLPSGWQHELLLDGDRVLVLTRTDSGVRGPAGGGGREIATDTFMVGGETTILTAVDVTDPADPQVEATLTLDGAYRSARMVDGVARVVVSSRPLALPFVTPETGGLRAEQEALERNRAVVEEAAVEDWLPWSVLTDGDGDVVREGPLLECSALRRPSEPAGLATLSVLSVDLARGLEVEGTAGVVADGETVYASADRLYVATHRWEGFGGPAGGDPRELRAPVGGTGTELHAFDLSDPRTAPYVGSGRVAGSLLNSYSLSAHEGYLRVATTTDGSAVRSVPDAPVTDGEPVDPGASESAVVILEERADGSLAEVGRIGGLGRTERIQAVRFLGDLATVVTFRQTDPLYTLDLSDPAAPALLGELKVPGYSAYLHPVGDGRLLGVGQDATEEGSTLGPQASLFDLSDLAAPTQLHRLTFGQGYSEVESDPRAFLYWPQESLAVVPLSTYGEDGQKPFNGAVALRVEGDQLVEVGRFSSPGPEGAGVRRALVVGEALYTVSDMGLAAHDLRTLAPLGTATF